MTWHSPSFPLLFEIPMESQNPHNPHEEPPLEDPLLGLELAGCRLVKRIGTGGMGAVYRAVQLSLNRSVAVKLIHPIFAADPDNLARFYNEARVVAALNHPHILQIYDVGRNAGLHYIIMEFIEGLSLGELATAGAPMELYVEILLQVLSGLGHAHKRSVIHRDLKPENILLAGGTHAKIADFGIAKMLDAARHLTATGKVVGTPSYISPEAAQAQPLDARSDIYSLGATFYHVLTGELLFDGPSPMAVVMSHLQQPPRPLRELRPSIPSWLARIIEQMLAKAPKDRFPDCQAIIDALEIGRAKRLVHSQTSLGGAHLSHSGPSKESRPQSKTTKLARFASKLANPFGRSPWQPWETSGSRPKQPSRRASTSAQRKAPLVTLLLLPFLLVVALLGHEMRRTQKLLSPAPQNPPPTDTVNLDKPPLSEAGLPKVPQIIATPAPTATEARGDELGELVDPLPSPQSPEFPDWLPMVEAPLQALGKFAHETARFLILVQMSVQAEPTPLASATASPPDDTAPTPLDQAESRPTQVPSPVPPPEATATPAPPKPDPKLTDEADIAEFLRRTSEEIENLLAKGKLDDAWQLYRVAKSRVASGNRTSKRRQVLASLGRRLLQAPLRERCRRFLRHLIAKRWVTLSYYFPAKNCEFSKEPNIRRVEKRLRKLLGLPKKSVIRKSDIVELQLGKDRKTGWTRLSLHLKGHSKPTQVRLEWILTCGRWRLDTKPLKSRLLGLFD